MTKLFSICGNPREIYNLFDAVCKKNPNAQGNEIPKLLEETIIKNKSPFDIHKENVGEKTFYHFSQKKDEKSRKKRD